MKRPVINLDDERLLRSYDKIGKAIVNYINEMGLVWEVEMAKKVYFGKYIYIIEDNVRGFSYKPFIQWLIFSYKLHNGQSLIECIYDKHMKGIKPYEKNALANLKNTRESLYKVYSAEKERVLVKDVFTNENVYLWDSFLATNVKRYCGLFTRILYMNNKIIPVPGYLVMTNSFLKDTEQYVLEKYREISKYNRSISIKDFINSNNLVIHRYFLHYSI